jgi:putative addiction module killer protein
MPQAVRILAYIDEKGRRPFRAWFDALDPVTADRVKGRIERLALGNAGDVAPVGEGVSELRIHIGPGYRV